MRKTVLLSAFIFVAGLAAARVSDTPTYVPAETPVAIVPIVNASSVTWQELKDKQVARGNDFLTDTFTKHGFKLVDPSLVTKAIVDAKLDLTDEENWKRETFYQIGEATGARLVLFVVIEGSSQHKSPNFFTTTAEGKADLKLWFVDLQDRDHPIFSAKKYQGSSKHSEVLFGTVKGSDLQVIAVANGLNNVLKDFFRPYPETSDKDK